MPMPSYTLQATLTYSIPDRATTQQVAVFIPHNAATLCAFDANVDVAYEGSPLSVWWSLANGAVQRVGPTFRGVDVAQSPDGTYVAFARFSEPVQVYAFSHDRLFPIDAPVPGLNWHVAWSPDSRWLAASYEGDDLHVIIYDASQRFAVAADIYVDIEAPDSIIDNRVTELTWATGPATSLTLAVAVNVGQLVIYVCDVTTDEFVYDDLTPLTIEEGHDVQLLLTSHAQCPTTLLCIGPESKQLFSINVETHTYDAWTLPAHDDIQHAIMLADGSLFYATTAGDCFVYDLKNNSAVHWKQILPKDAWTSLAHIYAWEAEHTLITTDYDGHIFLWQQPSNAPTSSLATSFESATTYTAIEPAKKIAAQHAHDATRLYYQGIAHRKTQQYQQAIQHFQQAAVHPGVQRDTKIQAFIGLAHEMERCNQLPHALNYYEQASSAAATEDDSHSGTIAYHIARLYWKMGDRDQAAHHAHQALHAARLDDQTTPAAMPWLSAVHRLKVLILVFQIEFRRDRERTWRSCTQEIAAMFFMEQPEINRPAIFVELLYRWVTACVEVEAQEALRPYAYQIVQLLDEHVPYLYEFSGAIGEHWLNEVIAYTRAVLKGDILLPHAPDHRGYWGEINADALD